MSLNITSYSPMLSPQGVTAQAPSLDGNTVAQVVALGAQSTAISGPALLCLISDEDQRVSLQLVAGYSAPSAAGIKLKAGVERYVIVGGGTNYISCVAG